METIERFPELTEEEISELVKHRLLMKSKNVTKWAVGILADYTVARNQITGRFEVDGNY
jgi:hypothetical protein